MKQITYILAFVCFCLGLKIGSTHIPPQRALLDGVVFFIGGCMMAIYTDRHARGWPNEFDIPQVK